jgi:hypothetical protein
MTKKRSRVIPKEPAAEAEFLAAWLNDMLIAGRVAVVIKIVADGDDGMHFLDGATADHPGVLGLAVNWTAASVREELAKVEEG